MVLLIPNEIYSKNISFSTLSGKDSNAFIKKEINRLNIISSIYYDINIDSALKYTSQAFSLSNKIDFKPGIADYYYLMSIYYFHNQNFFKALDYSYIYLNLQVNSNNLQGMIKGNMRIANFFSHIHNFQNANRFYSNVEKLVIKGNQSFDFAIFYLNKGIYYFQKNDYDNSYQFALKSLYFCKKCNFELYEAKSIKLLGDICIKQKKYDEAINYYQRALILFIKVNYFVDEGNIYSRLSYVYSLKGENRKILFYCKKALFSREKHKIFELTGSSLINLGNYYHSINKNDSSEYFYIKGLKILEDFKVDFLLENAYECLYAFYNDLDLQLKAFDYFKLYSKIHEKLLDQKSKSEIGLLYSNQLIKEQETRTELFRKENEIQKLNARNKTILLIFLTVLLLFSGLLISYIYIQNIKNKRSKESFKNLSQTLDAEIQERKLIEERLRASESLHRFMTDHSLDLIMRVNDAFNFTFVSPSSTNIYGYRPEEMISISPASLIHPDSMPSLQEAYNKMVELKTPTKFSYKTYKKNKDIVWVESHVNPIFDEKTGKVKELISVLRDITKRVEQEEALEESNRQKDLLMKEVHHRAKNNFAVLESLLFMQLLQCENEEMEKILTDLKSRVNTMALIHEQLYRGKSIKMVSFGDYLINLVNIISAAFRNESITVIKDIRECHLTIEIALPLGLIVNEMLTNAFKYAFNGKKSGKIWISLNPLDNNENESGTGSLWILTVKDNGIGLPAEYDIKKNKSMGSQIIDSLVGQIHGTLKISGKKGTIFKITFSESVDV